MNTEERQCMAEDRAKGKREDALIESGIVERFLRGGFECATFPSAQLLTDQEHKVICDHITDLTKQLADSQAHAKIVECKTIAMMQDFSVESSEFKVLNRVTDLFYALPQEGERAPTTPYTLTSTIPMQLGDKVQVTDAYKYGEWRGVELVVVGLRYDQDDPSSDSINVTVKDPDGYWTDGFKPEDFKPTLAQEGE